LKVAKDLLAFIGLEHGLCYPGASGTGGTPGSAMLGCVAVQNQYNRAGYQVKATNTSASSNGYGLNFQSGALGGAATQTLAFRVYFAIEQIPGAVPNLIACFIRTHNTMSNGGFGFRIIGSSYIEAGFIQSADLWGGTYTEAEIGDVRICPQHWYRLDAVLDASANPWTVDWKINGIDQTQVTRATAAADWNGICAGRGYSGMTGPSSGTHVMYTDDMAVTTDASQYPIGPGRSILLKPNGNGTHNPASPASTDFSDEAGNAIDANSWQLISDGAPPGTEGGDHADAGDGHSLRCHTPATGAEYLEFTFENITLDSGVEISCVHGWREHYQSSPAANIGDQMQLAHSGTVFSDQNEAGPTGDVIELIPFDNVDSELLRRILSPSSTHDWSESEVNNTVMRWGSNISGGTAGRYIGLSWVALELHLTADDEFVTLGCPQDQASIQLF
jgi:hypothetical protein